MATPQWTVSIIAQYTEKEDIVRKSYKDLIDIICMQGNTSVNFFVMQYHAEEKQTYFYTYAYDPTTTRRVEKRSCPKCTENFYDSPNVMIEFFRSYALKMADTHHFVMLWGHGAGFGTFAEGELPEPEDPPLKESGFLKLKSDFARTAIVYKALLSGGVATRKKEPESMAAIVESFVNKNKVQLLKPAFLSLAEDSFKMVSVESIALALSKSFGEAGKKVDILYAMSCYMQMFESGFLFRECADYYGGSEAFQLFYGPDYKRLFHQLATTHAVPVPEMKTLVSDMVNDFINLYTGPASPASVSADKLCLTFSFLPEFEHFNKQLSQLALYLQQYRDVLYLLVRNARARCTSFTSFEFGIVDIAQFCTELLKENLPGDKLRQILEQIVDSIQQNGQLIIARKPAPSLCTTLSNGGKNNAVCPQGLSIFFPSDKAGSKHDEFVHAFMKEFYRQDSKGGANAFLTNSLWDEFVLDYHFYENFPA